LPPAPNVNDAVTFDASASLPGSNGTHIMPIVSYVWNFGDGTPIVTEADPVTTHIYLLDGTYTVTLVVTDSQGLSDTASEMITISPPAGRIWTVDDDGPADFNTIQAAINAAGDGDIIRVASGIYYENVVVNKSVKLRGENCSTTIIDGNGTSNVVYVTKDNVEIKGFTIRNGMKGSGYYNGIWVYGCNKITIEHNIVESNFIGIDLVRSVGSVARGNKVMNNQYGIKIHISNGCIVEGNTVNASWSYGIYLFISDKNTIVGNTISYSLMATNAYGVYIDANSDLNSLYHNNFIDNAVQAYDNGTGNKWDDGYPSGGNYWSDYAGGDSNGDGIGDIPYVISPNGQDRYPLMGPWIVDTVPPVTTHDYDGLWHTEDFFVRLNATDDVSGVAEIRYRINGGSIQNVSVDGQPCITRESANNWLEYWSIDNAGNEEFPHKLLTGIKLDKTAPVGSITINNGDVYTISTSVTLSLTAADSTSGVCEVRFSDDGVWDTEPWEAPADSKEWTLPSGDGAKTVYYQIKDNAGLVSVAYSGMIILDTVPPSGSIKVAEGSVYTNTFSVTLTLSATDETSGVAQMCFSNDNVTWSSWETYAESKLWLLQGEDGAKTVYVQFRDNAGLMSMCLDSIILDTASPLIGIPSRLPSGDVFLGQPVRVSVNVTDAVSGVKNVTLYYTVNNGISWVDLIMNFNSSVGLYEVTISGDPSLSIGTTVKYKIVAYDNAENQAVGEGTGPKYIYGVVPEFPAGMVVPLLMLLALVAVALAKVRRRGERV
jgi:parallel beta-helix repeat protein